MKKTYLTILVAFILILGCAKTPKQLQLNGKLSINNSILNERYSFVPKDEFLKNTNWAYQIEAIPSGKYLLSNEQMVKTFLLAHNSKKIIIVGDKNEIKKYEEYLRENGVAAEIYLQPIDKDKEFVKLLFFNRKD